MAIYGYHQVHNIIFIMSATTIARSTINPQPQPTEVKDEARVLATQFFMKKHKATADDFEKARNAIYKLGIKSSYDPNRMIFSTLHTHKNNLANSYAQECNGLILETGSWRPLMIPPRSLRFNINTNASNKFLHKGLYHVYQAEDGTCINMYFYMGKWCISTARGYEMNDLKWESKTYQELVSECLSEIGLTWESFTEQLDQTRCYSFGFKHVDFHRFQPANRMWFIQSVDLDENSDKYMCSNDISPINDINPQVTYDKPIASLKDLYRLATNALETFVTSQLDDAVEAPVPCFGFILRSVNNDLTGAHSDLFIESSLMRQIRQIWYDNGMHKDCIANGWSKEDAVTLHAYLNSNIYENFMHLYPQYQERFTYYNQIIQQVVRSIVGLEIVTDNLVFTGYTAPSADLIKTTANNMREHFDSTVNYNHENQSTEQKSKVFTEFVVHPESLDLIMPLITRV